MLLSRERTMSQITHFYGVRWKSGGVEFGQISCLMSTTDFLMLQEKFWQKVSISNCLDVDPVLLQLIYTAGLETGMSVLQRFYSVCPVGGTAAPFISPFSEFKSQIYGNGKDFLLFQLHRGRTDAILLLFYKIFTFIWNA